MRPLISWSDLADASVGLWGLGVEGTASLRKLQAMGIVPVLVDDAPTVASYDGIEVLSTSAGGLEALRACDVVVKSPGISRYRPEVALLEDSGVPVRGGLGLWLADVPLERVVCITGTKGKSTTTALTVYLLAQFGRSARAGGNIGSPPWEPSSEAEPDIWVIETSSFQVPDLSVGPPTVAVTSLFPDHLDWHGTVERYYADKLSLCTKPGVRRVIAPADDAVLRAHLAEVDQRTEWVETDAAGAAWTNTLGLPGHHNVSNAGVARALLVALGVDEAADDARMAEAAEGFTGLPSRCRSIGKVGGVEFIDDSLSTNVLPARAALEAFGDRPVALLVGGHDRGLDYAPLALAIAGREERTLVVTMPDNGPRIGDAVRAVAGTAAEVVDASSLNDAVAAAYEWAVPDGVVLLSPAAPSFGRFTDYRERARAFSAAATRCGTLA
jgi:UDP-N-acetylmuramoyl-L-alanine---L-glutamate ligase